MTEPEHVLLFPRPTEKYYPGDVYEQEKDEVHESLYDDGTVTLNDRTSRGPDQARVFWRTDHWVDAKPRPATAAEVALYTRIALQRITP